MMIRTVNGSIPSDGLRCCLIHEHVSCASNDFQRAFGRKWLDPEALYAYAVSVLTALRERFGVDLFVDGTPIDLGRNVSLLRRVSEASGVHIVASTGFYWYPSFEADYNTPEELAQWLIMECEDGAEETDSKPGILKCAAGPTGMTEELVLKHRAIGITQRATGLPVYIHCEHLGSDGLAQLEALTAGGADPERLIFGHAAKRPDPDYLETLLQQGCWIAMDQCHCFPDECSTMGACLTELWRRGWGNQLLVGNDLCIHSDFPARHSNGLELPLQEQLDRFGHLFHSVLPAFLRCGGSQENWEQMLRVNALRALEL